MSHRRNEPAELHELREQVTEAKEGNLELRRMKAKSLSLREERGRKGAGVHQRVSHALGPLSYGALSVPKGLDFRGHLREGSQ